MSTGAVQGDFGPFEPRVQTDVPLWVALQLRKKQKCTVVWPLWLYTGAWVVLELPRCWPQWLSPCTDTAAVPPPRRSDDLLETHRYEKANALQFAPLPFHYIEIATMLFHVYVPRRGGIAIAVAACAPWSPCAGAGAHAQGIRGPPGGRQGTSVVRGALSEGGGRGGGARAWPDLCADGGCALVGLPRSQDVKTLRANKIRVGIDQVLRHSQEHAPPAWIQVCAGAALVVECTTAPLTCSLPRHS